MRQAPETTSEKFVSLTAQNLPPLTLPCTKTLFLDSSTSHLALINLNLTFYILKLDILSALCILDQVLRFSFFLIIFKFFQKWKTFILFRYNGSISFKLIEELSIRKNIYKRGKNVKP